MNTDDIVALRASLQFYVDAFPAFRSKPVGASGSFARLAQDIRIAEEDKARALLTRPSRPINLKE